jgi:hypothetical protein
LCQLYCFALFSMCRSWGQQKHKQNNGSFPPLKLVLCVAAGYTRAPGRASSCVVALFHNHGDHGMVV